MKASVTGSLTTVNVRPSAKVLAQPIIAKTHPPAPPISFMAKETILAKNPGKPVAPAELLNLRPGVPNTIHPVTVVKPSKPMIIPAGEKPASKVIIRPTGPKSPAFVPHPPTPATPVVIEHKAIQPVPTHTIPQPARITPHVEPRVIPQPARITPHVEPRVIPQPARITPHVEPRVEPHPARIAPHVEPKVEPHPARIAPRVHPREEPRKEAFGREKKE